LNWLKSFFFVVFGRLRRPNTTRPRKMISIIEGVNEMDSKQNGHEEERLNILKMVEEGRISASEAASLLSALSREKEPANTIRVEIPGTPPFQEAFVESIPPTKIPAVGGGPRWFRVRVTDMSSGRAKATVNLPIGLVNWGMKIGARYAPEVSDFDFNELSQMINSEAGGKLVDVLDEEDGEHVEIFID
jgi:hypothetical protein